MNELKLITEKAVPIEMAHINTDLIIPARYLTSTEKTGYGAFLFQQLREADKEFPLEQECYKDARILIALENFGCGSSREHAVWALQQYGFTAIIAPSFSDIFYSNSIKNRLPVIQVPEAQIQQLIQDAKVGLTFEINLADKTIRTKPDATLPFDMDSYTQYRLIRGVDDLDYVLMHKKQIQEYFNQKGPKNYE